MKPVKAKLTVKQLILLLLCASALLYAIHYLIFRDLHHLAIFGLHELAFVPLEVILVTLGLDQLVEKTHREEARSKVSIIETLYFNESGGTMLRYLTSFDPDAARLRELLQVTEDWHSSDFRQAIRQLKSYPFLLDLDRIDFFGLHYHLSQRHEYYRSMLENPALTQSEAFTEMIMKIYLLWEELDGRTNLGLQVVAQVKKHFRGKVFATIVPRNVRLGEAPSHALPINRYDPRSTGAEAYRALAREVMARNGDKPAR